jgi:hypothetical protein
MTIPNQPPSAIVYAPNCYFGWVCEASQVKGQERMIGEIYFGTVPNRQVPPIMSGLRDEIEMVSVALHQLFADRQDPTFRKYFAELLSLAQMGLVCDNANPAAAIEALNTLKKRIVRLEGRRIKSRYLNRLLIVAAIAGLVFWFAGLVTNHFIPVTDTFKHRPGNYLYMLAAAMPAIWLSFAARKKLGFSFEDLTQPEDDLMGPFHRVAYVVGFTLILSLLGYLKIAGVFLGDFSTQNLDQSIASALVFGAICGLSETLLATSVAPHATRIMTAMSQPSTASVIHSGGPPAGPPSQNKS